MTSPSGPAPRRSPVRSTAAPARAAASGAAAAVVVTLVLLWPALGRGLLLYRDFVSVPSPVLGPRALATDGAPPRAVPLDAVTALLAPVVPAGVQQQVLLLASLALAGAGVAALLRHRGVLASVTGAVVVVWSVYAGERLLLGQAPTLMGWAMTPWLVLATRRTAALPSWLFGVVLAAMPAALTPVGAVQAAVTVLVVAGGALGGTRQPRAHLVAATAAALLWSLPWLVPALRGATGAGDPSGARAFAVSAGSPLAVLDVLTGGGVWAGGAQLASRGTVAAVAASLGLTVVGLVGWLHPASAPSVARTRAGRGAVVLAILGIPAAAILAAGPFLGAVEAAQSVPGVALLRDAHRVLGVSVLMVALGVGSAVGAVGRRAAAGVDRSGREGRMRPWVGSGAGGVVSRSRRVGTALLLVSLAVLGAPDLPARLHAAYRPVAFPAGWEAAVAAAGGQTALVLPWQPIRTQSWAGPQPFLDPFPLGHDGLAVSARDLVVVRDGEAVRVGRQDPAQAQRWAAGELRPGDLDAAGITVVVEWLGTPGTLPERHPGLVEVYADEVVRVWRRAR